MNNRAYSRLIRDRQRIVQHHRWATLLMLVINAASCAAMAVFAIKGFPGWVLLLSGAPAPICAWLTLYLCHRFRDRLAQEECEAVDERR